MAKPALLALLMAGAGFALPVDPTGLAARVHFAEVLALDEAREHLGPAFLVPIKVICSQKIDLHGSEPWRTEVTLRRTDTNALRAHFGNRVQGETPAARKTHREMEM